MYVLKKLIFTLLFPYPLCLEITALGLGLWWLGRRPSAARVVATAGLLALVLLSTTCGGDFAAASLENRYEPLRVGAIVPEELAQLKWVVVLAASHNADARYPPNQQLGAIAVARLAEGIRLHRQIPGTKLLLSGGPNVGPVTGAELMAETAVMLGARREDIVLEGESRDTEDEARLVRSMIGDDRLILVTSAFHLPRSMALFRQQGMKPIPAPADRWTDRGPSFGFGGIMPSSDGLANTERALHEYLGIAWSKLRGRG